MFALGCVQSMRCHTDTCPTGIATQSPARQRGLVIPDKAERVARYHRATVNALHEIVVAAGLDRSEEHTSELQSLMRISYAVFCLKKKKTENKKQSTLTKHATRINSKHRQ